MGCIAHNKRKQQNTLDSTHTQEVKEQRGNYKVDVEEKATAKNIQSKVSETKKQEYNVSLKVVQPQRVQEIPEQQVQSHPQKVEQQQQMLKIQSLPPKLQSQPQQATIPIPPQQLLPPTIVPDQNNHSRQVITQQYQCQSVLDYFSELKPSAGAADIQLFQRLGKKRIEIPIT